MNVLQQTLLGSDVQGTRVKMKILLALRLPEFQLLTFLDAESGTQYYAVFQNFQIKLLAREDA